MPCVGAQMEAMVVVAVVVVEVKDKVEGLLIVLGSEDLDSLTGILEKMVPTWQQQIWDRSKGGLKEVYHFTNSQGPVWILECKAHSFA